MYDDLKDFRRANFKEFMQIYVTVRDLTETYQRTYERAEVVFSDRYGKRLFRNFQHFHTYKKRHGSKAKK